MTGAGPEVSDVQRAERRRELDLLGMVVVLGLVFFHALQIFSVGDFPVKNQPQSVVATALISFAALWGMPLMMLIAGIAVWYSLRRRTTREFLRDRLSRLLVPFVVGLPLLVPPQVYVGLLSDPAYRETYLEFFPRFFEVRFAWSFPLFIEGVPPERFFGISHLWFLLYLFVYTLLLLPLFLHLKRPAGERSLERVASFVARPWALYLLGVPVGLIEAAFRSEAPSGWNRFVWVPFILYGFLMARDRRFDRALQSHRRSALVLGTGTFLVYAAGFAALHEWAGVDPWTDFGPGALAVRFVKGISSWVWLVAIMGWAGYATRSRPAAGSPSRARSRRKPSAWDRFGEYAKGAQLPFYILHYLPIVVIGAYVVQWDLPAVVKYLVICLATVVVTLLAYDLGVKRTRVTRFLFGMAPRPRREVSKAESGSG